MNIIKSIYIDDTTHTVLLPVPEGLLIDDRMDVDEDHPLYGVAEQEPLDHYFEIDDFTVESLRKASEDVANFFDHLEEEGLLDEARRHADDEQIAYDFWLTRNGHGAGFWDGDYGDELGKTLTEICAGYSNQHVFVDESGCLHIEEG